MSIENLQLKKSLREKIEKRIISLAEDGIITGIEPDRKNYELFFYMAIQIVPKNSKQQFLFGKPEGIRVFISSNRKVIAAIDFAFINRGVRFSQVYQGPPLAQLVKTIKELQISYAKSKKKTYIELIQFFYIRSQFVLVKAGRSQCFYRNARRKLTKITLSELKYEIETILKDPPKFEKH